VAFDIFLLEFLHCAQLAGEGGCSPDPSQKPGAAATGDNDTVWEHWIDSPSITVAPGQTPSFTAPQNIPGLAAPWPLRAADPQPGWEDHRSTYHNESPFNTGPLIDQFKAYARFENTRQSGYVQLHSG